jgi:hypothetical protein
MKNNSLKKVRMPKNLKRKPRKEPIKLNSVKEQENSLNIYKFSKLSVEETLSSSRKNWISSQTENCRVY